MKHSLFILSILFGFHEIHAFNLNPTASKVLALGAPDQRQSYLTFLELHPDYSSWLNYQVSKPLALKLKSRLRNDYITAKRAFLTQDLAQAQVAFEHIFSQAFEHSWEPAQRLIVFDSALRRAQLSESEEEKDLWIKKAYCFDPTQRPSKNNYSPSFQRHFYEVKKAAPLVSYHRPLSYETFPIWRINGRTHDWRTQEHLSLCQSQQRVEYLSESYQPVVRVARHYDWSLWPTSLYPVVSGQCGQMQWLETQVTHIFFHKDCIGQKATTTNRAFQGQLQTRLPKPSDRSSWMERNWLWLGLGAIAGVLVATQNQGSERDSKDPVHRDGFN